MKVSPRLVQHALRGLALIACLFAVVSARVVVSARSELAKAESSFVAQDRDAAIVHLRRAARWYAPFSPYHARALEQLMALGREADAQGEPQRALAAYRAVRGAILATRSLYVPARPQLAAANERIAALMADEPPPGVDLGKSREQLRREHLALLTPIPGPDVFWSSIVLIGFACWVVAVFAFSLRAIDDEDRWVTSEVRRWGSLIVVGMGLFVLGMVLA